MREAGLQLLNSFIETCWNVLPILVIILFFQILVIRRPLPYPLRILTGFLYVIAGISFFLNGLQLALFPLGKIMAMQLTDLNFLGFDHKQQEISWQTYSWVYAFSACLGFTSALAEPSLLAVATKAEQISGGTINAWGLRIAVSFGVAFGLTLGVYRIISGAETYYFFLAGYGLVLLQTFFAPKNIVGLAYDSGGVTTSTVTVPLVTALGLGLAQHVPGRNPLLDGFGLIAFACLFSVISVLGYALLAEWWNKLKN